MTWWTLLLIVMVLAEIGILVGGFRWLSVDMDGSIKVLGCFILLACLLAIPLILVGLMALNVVHGLG